MSPGEPPMIGAGERVDGMADGASLALGSIAGSGASGGGRIMGMELSVHNELVEVGEFMENKREVW